MSSEIVEVEESRSINASSVDGAGRDVYVAVGKDDLDVLKWALDHAVSPGARVFLVHVCPPITHIPTPEMKKQGKLGYVNRESAFNGKLHKDYELERGQIKVNFTSLLAECLHDVDSVGKLSKSQLSRDQVRFYMNEENNRRRNNLQKYIRLCTDARVTVDTIILENDATAKAILDLIPVLNITSLVMGRKCSPRSRLLRKKKAKAELVKKNAPEYCEVSIVQNGKKVGANQQEAEVVHASSSLPGFPGTSSMNNSERRFFNCVCFSVKHNER